MCASEFEVIGYSDSSDSLLSTDFINFRLCNSVLLAREICEELTEDLRILFGKSC